MPQGLGCLVLLVLGAWGVRLVGEGVQEVINFVTKHENIAILIFSGVVLGAYFFFSNGKKKKVALKNSNSQKKSEQISAARQELSKEESDLLQAERFLAQVKKSAPFKRRSLVNDTEYHALKVINEVLHEEGQERLHIFPQVVMGAYLTHSTNYTHKAINSKRTDFLLVNNGYYPIAAIEIDGTGHDLDQTSALRDETKCRALTGAGIEYISVRFSKKDCPKGKEELRVKLREFIRWYKEDRSDLFIGAA